MSLDSFLSTFPPRQRAVLVAATEVYGEDTNDLVNAFQEIAARIAILTGIERDKFAAGVKHHWDYFAAAVNDSDSNSASK